MERIGILPTPYDVSAEVYLRRLADYLQKNVGEVTPPDWSLTAKTSCHALQPPQNSGWWYMRCASLLRTLYIHGTIGVSRLRGKYGGRRSKGRRREHTIKGGGSSISEPLQQLEKAGLVVKDGARGRGLSKEGFSVLDRLAGEIVKEQLKG